MYRKIMGFLNGFACLASCQGFTRWSKSKSRWKTIVILMRLRFMCLTWDYFVPRRI